MGKVQKTTFKKQDFINLLASMNHNEINEYIKSHGKPPKKIRLYHLIDNEKKSYDEASVIQFMKN